MDELAPKDISEISDVSDVTDFDEFLASQSSGLRMVSEPYGPDGERVIKPDAGDFLKWLRAAQPDVHVEVLPGRKLVLHSGDVWIPLVFLAKDIGLPVYLNLVSSYLYDRFKAALRGDKPRVHLSAEYVDGVSGSIKKFTFEGDHEALRSAITKFDAKGFFSG